MLFPELDHDAQLDLLERLARTALAGHYPGMDDPGLTLTVQQYEDNAVWRADTADGRSYGVRLSVRDGRTANQQRAEMRWLHSLAATGMVSAPEPKPTVDGDHVVQIDIPGHAEPCTLAVLSWVPGTPEPPFREQQVAYAMGEATARLHEHADTVTIDNFDRPVWDHETILENGHALNTPSGRNLLGADGVEVLYRVTDRVVPALAASSIRTRIHADLHRENLLALPTAGVGIIDFDDCGTGDPLLDVATVLSSIHRLCRADPTAYAQFARHFLDGYQSVRPLPTDLKDRLDGYLVLRDGFVLNFVAAAIPVNAKVAGWGPRRLAGILTDMQAYLNGQPYPGSLHTI